MMIRIKTLLACALIVSSTPGILLAGPIEFNFKDPKKVNNVVFLLDAPLESINGTATGISGKLTFDPDKPQAARGRIVLETKSLHVDNPVMKNHLHDADWMNVEKHPRIIFEADKLSGVRTTGNDTRATVSGKLTIKGITRNTSVPIRLTYLKGRLKERNRIDGDLLVLRADFTIKRSDYNINPGSREEKVSEEIEIKLRVAGMAPN